MKNITLKILVLTIITSFLFSCSNDDSNQINLAKKDDVLLNYTPIELEIVNLINEYRVENNLPKLNILNIVSNEAVSHTKYMVETGDVSHANFAKRYQHLVTYANAKSAAENVAYGYGTAQAVVNAWLNSDEHKHNIENVSYTDFGISTKSNSEGKYYFTNIFIKR